MGAMLSGRTQGEPALQHTLKLCVGRKEIKKGGRAKRVLRKKGEGGRDRVYNSFNQVAHPAGGDVRLFVGRSVKGRKAGKNLNIDTTLAVDAGGKEEQRYNCPPRGGFKGVGCVYIGWDLTRTVEGAKAQRSGKKKSGNGRP